MSLCKSCFLFLLSFLFFFARQCDCPDAHEICLPMWADSGSPPGHICDHRLVLMLRRLEAQSRLPSAAFISDPRVSPGRRTKQSTGVSPPFHSKPPRPHGCGRSCPHCGDQYLCFCLKKEHGIGSTTLGKCCSVYARPVGGAATLLQREEKMWRRHRCT